jgi:hypothetical protein
MLKRLLDALFPRRPQPSVLCKDPTIRDDSRSLILPRGAFKEQRTESANR